MNALGHDVILASASPYRAELLRRVLDGFRQVAADVDERRLDKETPQQMVVRLANIKARTVATQHPGSIVIGSDQIAALDDVILGKPHTLPRARKQLAACSARKVSFHTALSVVDARESRLIAHRAIDTTEVHFRQLSELEIERYLIREEPFDCAGSFKVELLGISLFDRVDSSDPTALTGLPLIACCRLLRACGVTIP